MTIAVNSYTAHFYVTTDHGSELEFVLSAAATRRGEWSAYHVEGYYETILHDMLSRALENTTSRITEICTYGDVSFVVESDSINELTTHLKICSDTVRCWIKKYNINKMKQ